MQSLECYVFFPSSSECYILIWPFSFKVTHWFQALLVVIYSYGEELFAAILTELSVKSVKN